MQPELRSSGSSSRDTLCQSGTLILGDGSSEGLVIVPRPLLSHICARMGAEPSGLLLGPELQGTDLLVEGAIPLGVELRQEEAQAVVGFYRVLTGAEDGIGN